MGAATPFALACVSVVLNYSAWSLFIELPGFLREIGASPDQIGVLIAIPAGIRAALGPLVGRLADNRGAGQLLAAGGILCLIASACYLGTTRPGVALWMIRALHGLGFTLLFGALDAYVVRAIPSETRSRYL